MPCQGSALKVAEQSQQPQNGRETRKEQKTHPHDVLLTWLTMGGTSAAATSCWMCAALKLLTPIARALPDS